MFAYVATTAPHIGSYIPDEIYFDGIPINSPFVALLKVLDIAVHNVTQALMRQGMWQHTLFIFTADHGQVMGDITNAPLRGSKGSGFEGAVRLPAFVNGGFLPPQVRGTRQSGMMHQADWYTTLCRLTGASPFDGPAAEAGLPQPEPFDMWSLVSGVASTSDRTELPLMVLPWDSQPVFAVGSLYSTIISGQYKLIHNPASDVLEDCSVGCLFDIMLDPYEEVDLRSQQPDIFERMMARLNELRLSAELPQNNCVLDNSSALAVWRDVWGGYIGPWLGLGA